MATAATQEMHCADHPRANVIIDSRAGDVICTECAVVIGERLATLLIVAM